MRFGSITALGEFRSVMMNLGTLISILTLSLALTLGYAQEPEDRVRLEYGFLEQGKVLEVEELLTQVMTGFYRENIRPKLHDILEKERELQEIDRQIDQIVLESKAVRKPSPEDLGKIRTLDQQKKQIIHEINLSVEPGTLSAEQTLKQVLSTYWAGIFLSQGSRIVSQSRRTVLYQGKVYERSSSFITYDDGVLIAKKCFQFDAIKAQEKGYLSREEAAKIVSYKVRYFDSQGLLETITFCKCMPLSSQETQPIRSLRTAFLATF